MVVPNLWPTLVLTLLIEIVCTYKEKFELVLKGREREK